MVPLFHVSMRRTNEDQQTMTECDYPYSEFDADARLASFANLASCICCEQSKLAGFFCPQTSSQTRRFPFFIDALKPPSNCSDG